MRIHTDTLTADQLIAATAEIPGREVAIGVMAHGSRSRDHAFEVKLTGHGARHTRNQNPGGGSRDVGKAATWDDWGWWLAALFQLDPTIIAGPYNGVANFDASTRFQFILEERAS